MRPGSQTEDFNRHWFGKFVRLGISVLEQIDLSLPADANWQLCNALERCNIVETELLEALEPGQFHVDLLGEELPDLIRTSCATDLSEMSQDLQEAISINIDLRTMEAEKYTENKRFDLHPASSKYGLLYENLARLVQETIQYRRELSARIDMLSNLTDSALIDFGSDYARAYQFIGNARVKSRIIRMHRELVVIEREQLHIAGIVILRSIMEAALVWALLEIRQAAIRTYEAYVEEKAKENSYLGNHRRTSGGRTPPIGNWKWDEIVTVARRMAIISSQETADTCMYFNSCRNRIHPWYDKSAGEEPSSKAYITGKIAYRRLYTELEHWRQRN